MNRTSHDPVSIQYMEREVEMYSLTRNEIQGLNSGDGGVELALACALGGVFISALITLTTVPMSNPALLASFVGCSLVTGILSLYFSLKCVQERRKAARNIDSILDREKKTTIAPIRRYE